MTKSQKDSDLKRCLRQIEDKLGWGSGSEWSTRDFERLSELVAQQTGVILSVTTLKRVWGRVRYESVPTTVTLNTLVQFLGYETWQQFRQTLQPEVAAAPAELQKPPLPRPARRAMTKYVLVSIALVIVLPGILFTFRNAAKRRPLSPGDFSFSSRPVTKRLPNSVVFRYDASASPTDSVFIQQSWDPRRRRPVSRNGSEHTSIYYYPGHFRAKLVVGKQVVREHNLLIPSDGWNIAVKQEPVPVYFKTSEVIRNGALGLPVSAIQQQHIPMQPQPPVVGYRYVRQFDNLQNDNFSFETRVKNDFGRGSSACRNIQILILCENNFFLIPLVARGCTGKLGIHLAGHTASSENTDLSAFGADLAEWTSVRCEVRNRHAQVFVNGKKAYEADVPTAPANVVGISYDFTGTGSVDFVRFLRADGTLAFEDTFDAPE